MIRLLADLAADSLIYLRDIGIEQGSRLIDDSILEIIPVNEADFDTAADEISFKPFFSAIKRKMQTERLLPTRNGYVARENAYRADTGRIIEIFPDKQLGELVGNPNAAWVFTTIGDKRAGSVLRRYINDITQEFIDESDLFRCLDGKFIKAQPLEWFHTFYKWLSETSGRISIARTCPFFLDAEGHAVAAFNSADEPTLFLPNDSGYPSINDALLQNPETEKFLVENIRLKKPSLKDEIDKKIKPVYARGAVTDDTVCFRKIFAYYEQCPRNESYAFLHDLRSWLKLRTLSGRYSAPKSLYLPDSELVEYFDAVAAARKISEAGRYFDSWHWQFLDKDFYLQLLGKAELPNFFKYLGVADEVRYLAKEFDDRRVAEYFKLPTTLHYKRHYLERYDTSSEFL